MSVASPGWSMCYRTASSVALLGGSAALRKKLLITSLDNIKSLSQIWFYDSVLITRSVVICFVLVAGCLGKSFLFFLNFVS
jgi:hypothetical protein